MKAIEIFRFRKTFGRESSKKPRHEAEDFINEKLYKGYRF